MGNSIKRQKNGFESTRDRIRERKPGERRCLPSDAESETKKSLRLNFSHQWDVRYVIRYVISLESFNFLWLISVLLGVTSNTSIVNIHYCDYS